MPFPLPESFITSSSRLELLIPVTSLLRNLMALHILADMGRHWVRKLQQQYLRLGLREKSKKDQSQVRKDQVRCR